MTGFPSTIPIQRWLIFCFYLRIGRGRCTELDSDLTNYICERAMEKGVFSICTGRGTLKLGPPISIPDDALIEGLKVYEEYELSKDVEFERV